MEDLIEAYLSVYEDSGIKARAKAAVDHQRHGDHGDDDALQKATKAVKKAVEYPGRKGPKVTPSLPESYDIVLEYLMNEGYADTEENAITIMANMSEEWIDEILDEAYVDYRKGRLPSGRTPQQAAQGRTALLNARAKAGENDPYGSKWQRRFNQSERTKEMDSHTGLGAKAGKQLWARDMGNEPNTERHFDARRKRKIVSDLKSAEKRSRG